MYFLKMVNLIYVAQEENSNMSLIYMKDIFLVLPHTCQLCHMIREL